MSALSSPQLACFKVFYKSEFSTIFTRSQKLAVVTLLFSRLVYFAVVAQLLSIWRLYRTVRRRQRSELVRQRSASGGQLLKRCDAEHKK